MINKLITFEGIDGVGKTTQINLFLKKLKSHNLEYALFREPGGTSVAEQIRNILLDNKNDMSNLTETLLFLASRSDLVNKRIKSNLDKDSLYIICDRFLDSTLAYQSFGRGINLELIQLVTQAVVQDAIPSTTFLLDCDLNVCLSRLNNKDRMENSGKDFLLKVKQGFLELALLNKNRYVIIDANQSITKIQDSIWTIFKDRYIK